MSLVAIKPANPERLNEERQDDEMQPFFPTMSSCYVCGRSGCKLLDQGPAVGMMCETCAQGFAVP